MAGGGNTSCHPQNKQQRKKEKGKREMAEVKIKIDNDDTYIKMDSKEFYDNTNVVNVEHNGAIERCRCFRWDTGIYMLIPERLVPREIKPTIVEKKQKQKKEKKTK